DDVDFRLERGGVVTGRVTDAEGNPVIGIGVSLLSADNPAPRAANVNIDPRGHMTDDRGVYRIYGLPAGRYRVSAGQSGEGSGAISFGSRKLYRRTFYPDATDRKSTRLNSSHSQISYAVFCLKKKKKKKRKPTAIITRISIHDTNSSDEL